MKEAAIAKWFYLELKKVESDQELDASDRSVALFTLFRRMLLERTQGDLLYFSTLFARMAYGFQRYSVERPLQQYLHRWRRWMQNPQRQDKKLPETLDELATAFAQIIRAFYEQPFPEDAPAHWDAPISQTSKSGEIISFQKHLRVVILEKNEASSELVGIPDSDHNKRIRIRYNLTDRNEVFNKNIREIGRSFAFPVSLQLIDIEIDKEGVHRPAAFVLEPDFLIDVTAIAECFKDKRTDPALFLIHKFLPMRVNKYLLTGHLANFFLDELLARPEATFQELLPQVFRLNPIGFCLLSDQEILEIRSWAVRHYQTLREMAVSGFKAEGIDPKNCSLEPTFLSMEYGLQGRLDIFHRSQENPVIVELKSGKAFRPNTYGLSDNHYVQTLLYDLLIRSAFGEKTDPKKYILYSGEQMSPLRYAPRAIAQQYEALEVRNNLISLERRLANTFANDPEANLLQSPAAILFHHLSKAHLPHFNGFAERDLTRFETTFKQLNPIEKKYFLAFTGFIAREHRLAKSGDDQLEGVNGQAGLWLNGIEEKEQSFSILRHLQLLENQAEAEEPKLRFKRSTDKKDALANFRTGDIGVLYPGGQHPLRNQLFKCIILSIDSEHLEVRLRSRVFNQQIFEEFPHWSLEPDLIDSSFTGMYRSLFAFAEASPNQRNRMLTRRAPEKPANTPNIVAKGMTADQARILSRMLAAPDYFLLWGPPGTGKTSVMIRELVRYLWEHSNEQILLLAYTNRAVDEICAAVESVGAGMRDAYIRIGSRYSCGKDFQEQLLEEKIKDIQTRKALIETLKQHRIYIGTLASWYGKKDLQEILSFDRIVIDEASQILEPMLAGLLPGFKRFILIGDHQQLPAVVTQGHEHSEVVDPDLRELGLTNMRNSLFERMYLQAIQQNWDWAYDQLRFQGRMHVDVMTFPNQHFYQQLLQILPEEIQSRSRQLSALPWKLTTHKKLGTDRLIFIPTALNLESKGQKTNRAEAEEVVKLIQTFLEVFAECGYEVRQDTIGVITPYRAQIALIRDLIRQADMDPDLFTIDTVERYQGGARDVILLSLCTNSQDQLQALVSLSDEGVDRKLNVALTRAREQIVVVGNPEVLSGNATYRALIEAGTQKSD
ncbi:MAG: AAA family ATPase [Saprospiraceae bacterium]|nr:AAA family ATPase [Saprospiraceae bacterium]